MDAPRQTRNRAKELRGRLSPPEVKLWMRLRNRAPGMPAWRRQHPVGPYILDFYCATAGLCVEIDGEGHYQPGRYEHDRRRTAYLNELGIEVIRYAAKTVLSDPDEVAAAIFNAAKWHASQKAQT